MRRGFWEWPHFYCNRKFEITHLRHKTLLGDVITGYAVFPAWAGVPGNNCAAVSHMPNAGGLEREREKKKASEREIPNTL